MGALRHCVIRLLHILFILQILVNYYDQVFNIIYSTKLRNNFRSYISAMLVSSPTHLPKCLHSMP